MIGMIEPYFLRAKRHRHLTVNDGTAHIESRKISGAPRIHGDLTDNGERVGKNTIACLMKKADIQSKVHKRFVVTTDSRQTKKPAKNILGGAFTTDKPIGNGYQILPLYPPEKDGYIYQR